ncbi:acyl-CoA dehydratase activase [Lacrimispora sp.]|uniref:acyl-CoA dehydratase activase n=1 Tax=Lacrimispora sp. TaxID=2719234 RepID=UPI002FDA05BA
MSYIGIDCGTASLKFICLSETNEVIWKGYRLHYGRLTEALSEIIKEFLKQHPDAAACPAVLTGSGGAAFAKEHTGLAFLGDIPAISEGTRLLCPQAASVIEIGSQHARYLTGLKAGRPPQFAVNEHCAGGTGSFFEDQMSRLGFSLEDYSDLTEKALSIPRISGRCAVFAKTDIIHRQQEGASVPDILLGLCYAMIKNYKAVIVKNLPVEAPVALCGGIAHNRGVIRAVLDTFNLKEDQLLIPEMFPFAGAMGAALEAKQKGNALSLLASALESKASGAEGLPRLPALTLHEGTCLKDPSCTPPGPDTGCALGIDIGSTSTNLVLIDENGAFVDFQYLRTAGNPEQAVRTGLQNIVTRFGELPILAVGVTGSGRERIGKLVGADAVRDEITAQAKAASKFVPDADTVFEIGGQDSKYISLREGQVADFQMNKICAAGTGSFVEEQAIRMGIPLAEFGPLALSASSPLDLGERCTVFIETSIASASAQGARTEDIAAGLCHSIVRNYIHKVVGSKPVGKKIVLQGGVAYNPGIVAAFQHFFGERLFVSPYFPVSGALGAAILAAEAMEGQKTHFRGYDLPGEAGGENTKEQEETRKNAAFYRQSNELLLKGYDGKQEPGKKTVGVPFVLMIHRFFPMANAFFKDLGFNVLLSTPTNENTIELSQQYSQGETCYPVKLIHGHIMELAEKKVDYIFLPSVHTMKHESSRVSHNYGCVYMQTAPRLVAKNLKLEQQGIKLLNPVFDLDFGKEAMASAMIEVGQSLGFSKPRCMKALLAGAAAVRNYGTMVEKQGKVLLDTLRPEDKVLVLITRNYGISDPVLNMGIPELLLERGHKVITLSHLPAHDLDISEDYPNLYWPFGQHILSGAKMVKHHPNLYAVYLNNHGCGPDTMISHMFRQEMGDKPYLQIEVDEHFSKVGVITRIEAFLNSLSKQPERPVPSGFQLEDVPVKRSRISLVPDPGKPLWLPELSWYSPLLSDYFKRAYGVEAPIMAPVDSTRLNLGRAETNSKEYLPFAASLGSILHLASSEKVPFQCLVPSTEGAEADGQYSRAIEAILSRRGLEHVGLVSPILESLPLTAAKPELLFRAILTGDLLFCAPPDKRKTLQPASIPDWEELMALASRIGSLPRNEIRLSAVGVPTNLFALNDGVLHTLETEGYHFLYAPLAEYLWFLWNDCDENKKQKKLLKKFREQMAELGKALGEQNSFSRDLDGLKTIADQHLPGLAGANGRYRYAKAKQSALWAEAVLTIAPRYENTALVLEMAGMDSQVPLYHLSMDHDWDEASWSSLRSFLYYVEKEKAAV